MDTTRVPSKKYPTSEILTPAILGGFHFFSQWLKTRLVEIKIELGQIHEQLREFEGV